MLFSLKSLCLGLGGALLLIGVMALCMALSAWIETPHPHVQSVPHLLGK